MTDLQKIDLLIYDLELSIETVKGLIAMDLPHDEFVDRYIAYVVKPKQADSITQADIADSSIPKLVKASQLRNDLHQLMQCIATAVPATIKKFKEVTASPVE